jgi:hypothetical protein
MSDKNDREITKRLDVIINLLLRMCIDRDVRSSLMDQIRVLDEMGLSSSDIGNIIGKESRYVASYVAQLKKKKGK